MKTEIPPPTSDQVNHLIGSFHAVNGAWSGTSYGYHPHGVVRRGIIFTDHHNIRGCADAKVILEPESGLIYPLNDSDSSRCGSKSLASIRPKSGGTVTVWDSGRWVGPDGPWRKLIVEILDELDQEVAALIAAKEAKDEAERSQRERKYNEQFEKAARAVQSI